MKTLLVLMTLLTTMEVAVADGPGRPVLLSDLSVVRVAEDNAEYASIQSVTGRQQKKLLRLVNAARKQGRQCGAQYYGPTTPVQWDTELQDAAERHSNDMAVHNFFNHFGSDGSTVASRVSDAGYQWRTVGENIAAGYTTPQEVVAGWLESPGHCVNIMNPNFKDMAIDKATNPNSTYGTYWTQVFGAELAESEND